MSSCFGPFHSHPSDLKHRFHRHQSSTSLHGSFNHNHVQDTNLPLVTEEHDENSDGKGPVYDPKQDVFVSLFVSLHSYKMLTCQVDLCCFPLFFPPVWEPADRQTRCGNYRLFIFKIVSASYSKYNLPNPKVRDYPD